MKLALSIVAASTLFTALVSADDRARLTGDYVEARTAEVFAGGCIMNSEAETMGRQAVMAWRITSGGFNGVPLDGLTVIAAVAGDRNLGMREMGGEAPTAVKAIITVDPRATPAQRAALVGLVRELTGGLITRGRARRRRADAFCDVGQLRRSQRRRHAAADDQKEMTHDPSCGAMQWFKPFTEMAQSSMGVAEPTRFRAKASARGGVHPTSARPSGEPFLTDSEFRVKS